MVLAVGAFLAPSVANAQDAVLRGSVTARYGLETETGDSQVAEVLVEPELTGGFDSNISYTLIGRVRYDAADELEPGDPGAQSAIRSPWNRRVFLGDDADLELREAYVDAYAGDWFFRLGKQQVVWGQSDGLRVLDQVNPLSFREFILGDFEDRRIPLWMANIERPIGPVTAQILWIPDTTYNEVPSEGTYAFSSPLFTPDVPENATSVAIAPANRPDQFFSDSDVGLRLTGFAGGWDWSFNALYAYLDSPIVRRRTVDDGAFEFTPTYERSTLVGGSASNAFGKLTLRTEFGYQSNAFVLTNNAADDDGVEETSELSGVIGLDFQADADTFISGQVFVGHLLDDVPFTTRDRTTATISLLASRELKNDRIKLEALLLQDVNQGDGLVQISGRYNYTNNVTIRAGADVFYGDHDGFYGQFNDRDRITISIEHGF